MKYFTIQAHETLFYELEIKANSKEEALQEFLNCQFDWQDSSGYQITSIEESKGA